MSRLVALVPVVALLSAAPGAMAETAGEHKPTTQATVAAFESLDRNADHRLSRSEAGFDAVLSQLFADTDVDGDGYVTRAEYAALMKEYNVASR